MTDNQNKNQNSTEAAEWQPDEAIIFGQQPDPAAVSAQLAQANGPTEQTGCFLNAQQSAAIRLLASQLDSTVNELKRILQILGIEQSISVKARRQAEIVNDSADSSSAIEGYFDGEKMIIPDGKAYAVPANYASKSKLVEGDTLKLIIGSRGNFIYKQIAPIERQRLVARLEQAPDGNYYAVSEHQRWRLIKASVSYFRAQPGDQIAILIPRNMPSSFAALENLVAE